MRVSLPATPGYQWVPVDSRKGSVTLTPPLVVKRVTWLDRLLARLGLRPLPKGLLDEAEPPRFVVTDAGGGGEPIRIYGSGIDYTLAKYESVAFRLVSDGPGEGHWEIVSDDFLVNTAAALVLEGPAKRNL